MFRRTTFPCDPYNGPNRAESRDPGNEIKAMEHPTLKVPYEMLNKKYRASQKTVDREANHMMHSMEELKKSPNASNVEFVTNALDSVVEKLQAVKRKLDDSLLDEEEAASVCNRRLEHLKGMFEYPTSDASINAWKRKRLDRFLVDHLLRGGYYNSAIKLAEQSDIKHLTNIDLFMVTRAVEDSLAAGDTSKCLLWCHDNKSKLRKMKSPLELKLRQQEFIELVKQNKKLKAIIHARKYLSVTENSQREELEHIMGLLVHPLTTKKEPYRSLLDKSRWNELVDLFKQENYNLHQLNSSSVFSAVLQAGLSALKSPYCYKKNGQKNPECPLCSPLLNELTKDLPFPHCPRSKLICAISGQSMDENNPPMMLPNGYIYGEQSLRSMASLNKGRIRCPKTLDEFDITEIEKVYVV